MSFQYNELPKTVSTKTDRNQTLYIDAGTAEPGGGLGGFSPYNNSKEWFLAFQETLFL